MSEENNDFRLARKLDRVYIQFDDGTEEKPVKLVWARPVSGIGQEVSVVGMDKKEVVMIEDLADLDPESRKVAEAELEQRYLMPRITRVVSTSAQFGSRYWDVETNRGRQKFLMKDPSKSVIWVTDDRLVLRDVVGNQYEIESYAKLDPKSRIEVERVI